MQYSQLKVILKGRLARFSSSTSLDPYIVGELNASMIELEEEGFLPWFLFAKKNPITAQLGVIRTGIPSDIIREQLVDSENPYATSCRLKNPDTDRWEPLFPLGYNPVDAGDVTETVSNTGKPTKYFIDRVDAKLYLNRWTDKVYSLALDYVKEGDRYTDDPADDEEPLWAMHAPGYLIAAAGFRIAHMYIKNTSAASIFTADMNRERTKLIHKHTTILESKLNPNTVN